MTRIVTAIALGAAVVAAVWWLPAAYFNLLILAVASLGLLELAGIYLPDRVERCSSVAAGAAVSAAVLFGEGFGFALLALPAVFFALSLLFMRRTPELTGVAQRLGIASMGILYVGVSFSFWGPLRELSFGRELVLLALAPACLCDTFAYVAGKTMGKHKFAPRVSPNKTMEGFFGALAGSLAGVFLVRWLLLPHITWQSAAAFAVLVWIVSPFGDLVESMLKRSAGVKDSGNLIPGHGGVLDRLDALIFTGPAAYAFARYIFGM